MILLTLALTTALSEPIVEGPRCPTAAGEQMRERERRDQAAAAEDDAPDPIAWAALAAMGVLATLGVRAIRIDRVAR